MELRISDGALLTTKDAASSHGVPVLLIGDQAYGAADRLPAGWRGLRGGEAVALWAGLPGRTVEEAAAARAYCASWPDGPQCGLTPEQARTLGARGGAAGRGSAKRRGDSAHYRAIRAEAVSLHVGAQRLDDGEWLAGVWAADNRLAWSSETTSYPTQAAARAAAREAKRRLIAGEITPHTISLRAQKLR